MDFVCLSGAGYEKIALLMRNVSFFLTKTIMDEQLCELLKQFLENPEGSSKRDEAAKALALIIDQLPEPKKYLDKYLLPHYEEALKRYTEPDVEKNIYKFLEKYKLNVENINCKNYDKKQFIRKNFINWVMMILKSDCIDIWRSPRLNPSTISIDEKIGENFTVEDTIKDITISGLEKLLHDELKQIGRQLKNYIETDLDNELKNCHSRNNQDCNCKVLAQLILLNDPPIKIKEIAQRINTSQQTIYDRWKNYCKPLLKQIAKELGYE